MDKTHKHIHSHEHTKEVSNRLARAIGHLQKVKQMVEDGEDCSEVLVQLAAVKSAINNTGKVILKDHMDHCIIHAVEDGNTEMLDELTSAIDKFIK
jgi:DNA-binding FrmR family transcriptional regulator